MTMNGFHFNGHKQDTWKCDWLIGHIISISRCQHKAPRVKASSSPSLWWVANKDRPPEVRLICRKNDHEERDHPLLSIYTRLKDLNHMTNVRLVGIHGLKGFLEREC